VDNDTSATMMKRRVVTSLSPAKERHLLVSVPPNKMSGQLRPPLTRGSQNTKSSNLASGSRPPTKPPPLPRHSIAVSQEETCLVSAAGDVLVCRSREFSQLMAVNSGQHGLSKSSSSIKNNGSVGWCEMECSDLPLSLEKSSLCNPWMTRLSTQREEKKEDDPATAGAHYSVVGGLRGGSTYEWNPRSADPVDEANRTLGDLELEVANSPTDISTEPASPVSESDLFEGDDEDRVLSMPSFDYSHFGNGGNDMLPTSPARSRPRRPVDLAEMDVSLGFKNTHNIQRMERISSRVSAGPTASSFAAPTAPVSSTATPLFHGVPTFLTSLLQVRIQQVSAHPRGSHVLMISAEALLFSYGLNDHGQLGIGIKSPPAGAGADSGDRYVWTPTIITPLLENGGKAIACAAGESHSLVVVSTEGRRVLKSKSPRGDSMNHSSAPAIQMNRVSSSPPTIDTNREQRGDESEHSISSASATAESVWHHQLYGFGRNNFMKIGLIHPKRKANMEQPPQSKSTAPSKDTNVAIEGHHDDMEDVLLPHRVALHCTVWPERDREESQKTYHLSLSGLPRQGIFALAASSEHSAALVRRATGDIELYTWGNAAYHALGISQEKISKLKPNKVCPVPTLVEQLSYLSSKDADQQKACMLESDPPEFPVDISLGPYSSFVVTSSGRCLSFGISYDGMLGHGRNITEIKEPKAIAFPGRHRVTSISAGTGHVMALASGGTVYTWGKNTDGRLGLGHQHLPTLNADVSDLETTIEWTPQEVAPPTKPPKQIGMPPPCSAGRDESSVTYSEYGPVVQVCAGLDCSIFVTSCGQVLSCGKHSGRLGLGESEADVHQPTPLFGGLRLWYRPAARPPSRKASPSPSPAKHRPALKRGLTLPG
jgi:alpha-tubulin suppressor-like RCC1 family protein